MLTSYSNHISNATNDSVKTSEVGVIIAAPYFRSLTYKAGDTKQGDAQRIPAHSAAFMWMMNCSVSPVLMSRTKKAGAS